MAIEKVQTIDVLGGKAQVCQLFDSLGKRICCMTSPRTGGYNTKKATGSTAFYFF